MAQHLAPGAPLDPVLTFRNPTRSQIRVLGSLDGSIEHWREPQIDFYLRDDATARIYRFGYSGSRCGNTNSIGEADYTTIAPNAGVARLGQGWTEFEQMTAPPPGRYTAWVTYRFCGFPPPVDAGTNVEGGTEFVFLRLGGPDVEHGDAVVGVFASNAASFEVP